MSGRTEHESYVSSLLHRNARECRGLCPGDGRERHRGEVGNLQYEYFQPLKDADTILLIDSWRDQEALDAHHASSMMKEIAALREKYDLNMKVERFVSAEDDPGDAAFVRQ